MTIEIIIDGATQTVTKQELFRLVTSGAIGTDIPVSVNGKLVTVETAITMDTADTVRPSSPVPQPTPVRNDAPASERSNFTPQIGENCRNLGCTLTIWGFIIPFIVGFIWGLMGLPEGFLPIIWIVVGLGGFAITAGLILLVIGWVIPKDPAVKLQTQKRELTAEEKKQDELANSGILALIGCIWVALIMIVLVIMSIGSCSQSNTPAPTPASMESVE